MEATTGSTWTDDWNRMADAFEARERGYAGLSDGDLALVWLGALLRRAEMTQRFTSGPQVTYLEKDRTLYSYPTRAVEAASRFRGKGVRALEFQLILERLAQLPALPEYAQGTKKHLMARGEAFMNRAQAAGQKAFKAKLEAAKAGGVGA